MQQPTCRQVLAPTIFVAVHNREFVRTEMTPRNALTALGDLFDIFGSAIAASRAIEANRQPSARHLRTLGIDPKAFREIVRR
jgi:hypothetical protein